MFGKFVDWNYIVVNPAAKLERPRDDRTAEATMHALDATGLRALVEAATGRFSKTLLLTAAMTGVRRGELLALRWKDVDYTNGRLWVRGSVGLGGKITKPKTKRSVRAIALPKTLADELEQHWKESAFRADSDFVFASEHGTPLDGRNVIRTVFEPARKRAGLVGLRFHDLRQSYTSVLVAQGVPPKVISEQLGHASIQITMDRYAHLFDSASTNVSAELEKAWAAQTASGLQADPVETDATAFHGNGVGLEKVPANGEDRRNDAERVNL
jgi:integrase